MFKKNSYLLGIFLGILFPAILTGLYFGVDYLVRDLIGSATHFSLKNILFISIALNIIPIRYYLMNEEIDRTGKGILLITVITIILVTVILK